MKRQTAKWVRKAEEDWSGARKLADQKSPLRDLACFHSQQAAEKYLKALLQEAGAVVPKTHDLKDLLDLLLPPTCGACPARNAIPAWLVRQVIGNYRFAAIQAIRGTIMNLLVTAGNTLVPIDSVRCITNIFTGRTGAAIARCAWERGHSVTLLTSHPEAVENPPHSERWAMLRYRTFEDLQNLMSEWVTRSDLHAIIQCAAVSDYLAGGIYAPAEGTRFHPEDGRWQSEQTAGPALVDRAAGKVKSDEPELWLRLVRAPKLIDLVRRDWGFRGLLVKFKLEVGVGDEELLTVAERSRTHSAADLIVANTLEGAGAWAFLGPLHGQYQRVPRQALAESLLIALEQHPRKHSDG
jgi:hypothetical protein